jgi:hypothetical protein
MNVPTYVDTNHTCEQREKHDNKGRPTQRQHHGEGPGRLLPAICYLKTKVWPNNITNNKLQTLTNKQKYQNDQNRFAHQNQQQTNKFKTNKFFRLFHIIFSPY